MGFATDAIHIGQEPDPATGAIVTPIYQTSTFVQEGLGRHKGYEYARSRNPTRDALERNLAALEGGAGALAFASGMAAINAVLSIFSRGDHVVCTRGAYGGTLRLFNSVLTRFGLEFAYADTTSLAEAEKALRPNSRLLYVETPTNPLMALTDLRAAAELANSRGLLLAVDNTFMSPYFQRPLALGADIVIHSTTKYLNGHSDGIGGAVVVATGREELLRRLKFIQNAAGAILGPMDSWLVLRGVKTLAVRMRQHNENAMAVAAWLNGQVKVARLYYPGLPGHPQHELARRQMSGFGGMIAFELHSFEAVRAMLGGLRVCSLGESLGGVETLVSHPATMSHVSLRPEERAALGISERLVRISVGIEDVEDIIGDLGQAMRDK
jgi:cystathionine gamma-lyase/cystathionine beta-lyase/cystathionine gamma-lyase/homocysteine desulfhydrase